ncbi:ThuA domain-containing protein [Dyadobacter flavalbus]|uniref:ThuA domain-containing protein n=1 Tax=Dyadobacter flavalbus TaxID=2579942 RepID=A0A5M8QVW0_9BACT|nr:ThuA domain-containing protein [Dyadobacter flavalbus]KAA6440407.1 ThuA domain-containing protein [Dyadobacter flavalbus]
MKRTIKITLRVLLCIILFAGATTAIFLYKIKNGFPVSYETEKPAINFPPNQPAILIFSKTTGFRHAESIKASLPVFSEIARENNWFIYQTEEGGIFNPEQLKRFKVVVFNNSTGRVLNDEQQEFLSQYVESGGTLLGIHGAGDDSHHWPWYETHLLGTRFSHHPLNPQFQKTAVHVALDVDSTLTRNLPAVWTNEDEWYVFFSQPEGMRIVSYINGNKIIPNGNLLWIRDKNFGMGQNHPVAWYRNVGKGKTFYTSMGHSKEVWQNKNFVQMIENAIIWSE